MAESIEVKLKSALNLVRFERKTSLALGYRGQ